MHIHCKTRATTYKRRQNFFTLSPCEDEADSAGFTYTCWNSLLYFLAYMGFIFWALLGLRCLYCEMYPFCSLRFLFPRLEAGCGYLKVRRKKDLFMFRGTSLYGVGRLFSLTLWSHIQLVVLFWVNPREVLMWHTNGLAFNKIPSENAELKTCVGKLLLIDANKKRRA